MKKLLFIALFSIAIVANATEKKETVVNNSNEVKVEKSDSFNEVKTEKVTFVDDICIGCGEEGNGTYRIARSEGKSHRQARTLRRAYVRKCRNYFWQFGIF